MAEVTVELEQQVAKSLGPISKAIAEEVHMPENHLQTIDMQAKKIEHELSQYMLLAKKRIRDGFQNCVEAVKALSAIDPQIDIESLKENVNQAFSRFDTVAIAKDMATKVVEGKTWKTLLGLSDLSMELLYRGAKDLFDSGRHPEAEAAFFFLTTVDYTQYTFWLGLGHAAFHLGNLNQAINAYEMADSCVPGSIWPHIYMANCFEALNDYSESLNCLQAAESELQNGQEKNDALSIDLRERIANAKNRA